MKVFKLVESGEIKKWEVELDARDLIELLEREGVMKIKNEHLELTIKKENKTNGITNRREN